MKRLLLETYDVMSGFVASPKCGFNFCEAAMANNADSPCEHIETCRVNFALEERIASLRRQAEQQDTEEGVQFLCTLKGGGT